MLVTLLLKLACVVTLLITEVLVVLAMEIGTILLSVGFVIGPLLVPGLVMPYVEFLFNGWLKFILSAGMYKIVASVFVAMFAKTITTQISSILSAVASSSGFISDEYIGSQYVAYLALFLLSCISIYLMLQIPSIANGIVSGGTGGAGEGFTRFAGNVLNKFQPKNTGGSEKK
ncbi:hypothetical protein ACQUFY_26305 (plasmid) [Robbsia andropogonis]|uniref:hypothetical protein n=1 Tax=Robbsia andropogonis TaxID=28092 RepID=UPI003D24F3E5